MMIENLKKRPAVVVCLHCGLNTPLPESTNTRYRGAASKARVPGISLVRCRSCGKEAPYLAGHIIELKAFAKSAAAAAG